MPCRCTPQALAAHGGHVAPCPFAAMSRPAAPPPNETDAAGSAMVSAPSPVPVPAPYAPPTLSPVVEGHPAYPIAHALALLVQAREHCPSSLAGEITAFVRGELGDPPLDPFGSNGGAGHAEPEQPTLTQFAPQPNSVAAQRLQRGAVMPAPPPPAPAFQPPPAVALRSPPYSNGCPHPGTRLAPNGRGVTCLDCGEAFPGFNPRAA